MVSEEIVAKWFTVLADRFNRDIEKMTVKLYLDAFDRAKLTDRGLNAACQWVFDTERFLPPPESFIDKAQEFEREMRIEERPKLPRMDKEEQHRVTADQEYQARMEAAVAWGEAHPDRYDRIRKVVTAEHLRMAKVPTVRSLSPMRAAMLSAAIVSSVLSAMQGPDDGSQDLPPESTPPKAGGLTKAGDVLSSTLPDPTV
jgi:ribosomal protein S30